LGLQLGAPMMVASMVVLVPPSSLAFAALQHCNTFSLADKPHSLALACRMASEVIAL